MPLPRREIDEILQLHVREGAQVQEVFVEGTADKYFYEAFLAASNLDNVAVLDVGGVNVPDAEVVNLGLAIGKKGRVVTLAALLEGKVSESEVVCIADADLDHFKRTRYGFSLLLLTDGTSIELYVLCPVVLSRILNVALGGFPKSPAQVTEELAGPLQEAFLARVAADDLGFPPHFPETSAFCVFDKHRNALSFKLPDYLNKTFEHYADRGWQDPMRMKIEERRWQLTTNISMQINGHDFVETFAWYVRRHAGFGNINPATFAKMILGSVDAHTLAGEPLFQELLRRLRSA